MSIAEARTSTLARVLIRAVAIVLLVNGMFYLFDGDWPLATYAVFLGCSALCGWFELKAGPTVQSVTARSVGRPWLVLLIGSAVLVVLVLTAVGVVCGNEQGFSCGGGVARHLTPRPLIGIPISGMSGRLVTASFAAQGRTAPWFEIGARHGSAVVHVYELDLEDAERHGIRLQDIELPVPRLPAGKGVRVFRNGIDSIGQVSSAYFTIAVVGKTIDGIPIREELLVSKSGGNRYPGTDTDGGGGVCPPAMLQMQVGVQVALRPRQ